MPGWASAYVELHTLSGGHSDTVNHLSFSPDGLYLASCSDDQSLIIWNVSEGRLLYRALFKSKVERSIWHPAYPATVLVGCDNGYLYQLHEFSPAGGEKTQIELGVRSTIHCLAYDSNTRCLAVGLGADVYITREVEINHYEGVYLFPSPSLQQQSGNRRADTRQVPVPRDAGDRESRLQPVDVHFLKSGEQLLASYLAHGITCWDIRSQTTLWTFTTGVGPLHTIGSSALSPRGDDIAVYNVVDGVDIYGIKSSGGMRRKPKRTLKYPRLPRTKHALQATYIIDGRGIVCGTTTGDVCVWDTANSEVYQVLNHDKEEIIQAVAGVNRGEYSYVATATVDKGQATYVKVWRAKYVPLADVAFTNKVFHAVRAVKDSNKFSRSKVAFHRWILPPLCLICTVVLLEWLSSNLPWQKIWADCASALSTAAVYMHVASHSFIMWSLATYAAARESVRGYVRDTLEELRVALVDWLRVDEVVVRRVPRHE